MTEQQRTGATSALDVDLARSVLSAPMRDNDAEAATVREYLITLLSDVWTYEEEFDSKRPFGNSGWKNDIYDALADAGLVHAERDADGFWDWWSEGGKAGRRQADDLVRQAIDHLDAPADT